VLHQYRDETLKLLGDIDDLFQLSKSHAQQLLASVDFTDISGQCVPPILECLSEISRQSAPQTGSGEALAEVARQMEELKSNYTMGSERHVHAAVLSVASGQPGLISPPPASPAAAPPAAKPAGEDLGGNVELF
jgi:hypothetical protein